MMMVMVVVTRHTSVMAIVAIVPRMAAITATSTVVDDGMNRIVEPAGRLSVLPRDLAAARAVTTTRAAATGAAAHANAGAAGTSVTAATTTTTTATTARKRGVRRCHNKTQNAGDSGKPQHRDHRS